MDERRNGRHGRHATLRAAFATALHELGMDPGIAHRSEIEDNGYAGANIHHAAPYSPNGRDFFTINDRVDRLDDLRCEMADRAATIGTLTIDSAVILAACERIGRRASEAFRRTGITGLRPRFILRETSPAGVDTIHASIEYEGLDDMLETTPQHMTLSDPHDPRDPANPLVTCPAAEILRRKRLGGREPRDARRISGHLVRAISALEPSAILDMVGRIDSTQEHGVETDDRESHGIGDMAYVDGMLVGTIRIGDGLLDGDVLTMPGIALPDTVLLRMRGRRAGDVVDHPVIADRRIVEARNDEEKGLVLKIRDRPLPLETTLKRFEDA